MFAFLYHDWIIYSLCSLCVAYIKAALAVSFDVIIQAVEYERISSFLILFALQLDESVIQQPAQLVASATGGLVATYC